MLSFIINFHNIFYPCKKMNMRNLFNRFFLIQCRNNNRFFSCCISRCKILFICNDKTFTNFLSLLFIRYMSTWMSDLIQIYVNITMNTYEKQFSWTECNYTFKSRKYHQCYYIVIKELLQEPIFILLNHIRVLRKISIFLRREKLKEYM